MPGIVFDTYGGVCGGFFGWSFLYVVGIVFDTYEGDGAVHFFCWVLFSIPVFSVGLFLCGATHPCRVLFLIPVRALVYTFLLGIVFDTCGCVVLIATPIPERLSIQPY